MSPGGEERRNLCAQVSFQRRIKRKSFPFFRGKVCVLREVVSSEVLERGAKTYSGDSVRCGFSENLPKSFGGL